MNKIFSVLLFFILHISYGQNRNTELYKSMFKTADSLKANGHILDIDDSIYAKANELDKLDPSKYFERAKEYLNKLNLNEATFLYHVGRMRNKYYDSTKTGFKKRDNDNDDIDMLIGTYLMIDVNNFISILKKVVDYCERNDYLFYSKSNDIEKYERILNSLKDQIIEVENNKPKYINSWDKYTKSMKEMFK